MGRKGQVTIPSPIRTLLGLSPHDRVAFLIRDGHVEIAPAESADPASLVDPQGDKRAAAERAMDKIRTKFGGEAVGTGRAFKKPRS